MGSGGKMNKKAQSDFLTWFTAFVVIFFIILVFIAITAFVTTSRKLDVGNFQMQTMENKLFASGDFALQRELGVMLNERDKEWKRAIDVIENDFEKFNIDDYFSKDGCYVLCVVKDEVKEANYSSKCSFYDSESSAKLYPKQVCLDFIRFDHRGYNSAMINTTNEIWLFKGFEK